MKTILKKSILIALAALFSQSLKAQTPGVNPTNSQNYVVVYTPRVSGVVTSTGLDTASLSNTKLEATVQYFDGLGRPIQTIQVKGSPAGRDMVVPMTYDAYGREVTKYEPYAVTGSAANDGSYKTTAITDQGTFFTTPPTGVTATPFPFSKVLPEASPLSRTIETGAPGDNWQLTGTSTATSPGHTVKMVYTTNNSIAWATDSVHSMQVAMYNVTINNNANFSRTIVPNGYYSPGTLDVTVSEDDNWVSGRAGTVETYKDNEGHVVLKRVYNYTTSLQVLSTYYIYDNLGDLAYVLPPAAGGDAATTISQTTLNNYCYQYRYDARNRLSQKKLPGKGWEFTVYNVLDQPVASQDSLQRTTNNWIFTKYDAMGRVIMSGTWNNNNVSVAQSALQTTLNGITTNLWETSTTTGNGYTNVSWPTTYTTSTLGLNYYDSYSNIPGLLATYHLTSGVSTMLTGLMTAKETAVLNTPSNLLWDVMYYDDLGRTITTYNQHYLGGTANTNNYDLTKTTYSFTNVPTTTTRQHFTSANTTTPLVTIANQYIYDQMDRKLKTWEQITNGSSAPTTRTLLSQLTYNEAGQLMTKQLHSTDSVSFLQKISYSYNERGWLLQSSAPLFQEQLQYNAQATGKQYNGNIAYQLWGTAAAPNTNTFTYKYDKLNRLISGASIDHYAERGITYDLMGNISTLSRVYNNTVIDSLNYNYNSTNQLQSVNDLSTNNGTVGYPTGSHAYTYDGNGNLKTDPTKGTGITVSYNLLNLPQAITGGKTITYTYDASGQKLRRVSPSTGTTDYISGIQYDDNNTGTSTISFIQTEEGKAIPIGTTYNYEYYLTDHLGNSRIGFDTQTGAARQVQQDDYMPFGMEIMRYVNGSKNEYLYNKKEMQEELTQYDFGARNMDPLLGRWTTIDPLTEKYFSWTPYSYVMDNPIKLTDPNGKEVIYGFDGSVHIINDGDKKNIYKDKEDESDENTDANTNIDQKNPDGTTVEPQCCATIPGQAQADHTATVKRSQQPLLDVKNMTLQQIASYLKRAGSLYALGGKGIPNGELVAALTAMAEIAVTGNKKEAIQKFEEFLLDYGLGKALGSPYALASAVYDIEMNTIGGRVQIYDTEAEDYEFEESQIVYYEKQHDYDAEDVAIKRAKILRREMQENIQIIQGMINNITDDGPDK